MAYFYANNKLIKQFDDKKYASCYMNKCSSNDKSNHSWSMFWNFESQKYEVWRSL